MTFVYKKRFVAYLDILGFEKLLERQPSPDNIKNYIERLLDAARAFIGCAGSNGNSSGTRPQKCHAFLMSDTIVIYSEDESAESFCQIVNAVDMMFQYTLPASLGFEKEKDGGTVIVQSLVNRPLRGAISHGEFYANETRNIYFGNAFIDASSWEKKQDWIGAILTPTCATYIKSKGFVNDRLIEYDHRFLKPENKTLRKVSICFNWIINRLHKLGRKSNQEMLTCLNWPKNCRELMRDCFNGKVSDKSSDEFKAKLKHTVSFFKHCTEKQ